jgi:acetyl-CoA C-acetyltransferase
VQQIGEQGACIARNSVLLAGWPDVVTGVTLNRFCGSGLQAVNFALMGVASGMQDLVVGGGVESMSRVPMGSDGGGLHGKNVDLLERVPIVPQGISADLIATREGFTREQCDRFAWESQQNTQRAVAERRYRSIVPVRDNDGSTVLERDEYPRPETSLDGLAQLKPSFAPAADYVPPGEDGLSLLQRAAEALPRRRAPRPRPHRGQLLGHRGWGLGRADRLGTLRSRSRLKPRAKVLATATCGAEPVIMLTAPGPASERALAKAGMQKGDVDLWEINEAFAAIPLKVMRDLDVPRDRV